MDLQYKKNKTVSKDETNFTIGIVVSFAYLIISYFLLN